MGKASVARVRVSKNFYGKESDGTEAPMACLANLFDGCALRSRLGLSLWLALVIVVDLAPPLFSLCLM